MNINESMEKNLSDLAVFLHHVASLDVSQLGSEWESQRKLLRRHAVYVETYTLPELSEPTVAQFTPPSRNGAALYGGPLEGEPA